MHAPMLSRMGSTRGVGLDRTGSTRALDRVGALERQNSNRGVTTLTRQGSGRALDLGAPAERRGSGTRAGAAARNLSPAARGPQANPRTPSPRRGSDDNPKKGLGILDEAGPSGLLSTKVKGLSAPKTDTRDPSPSRIGFASRMVPPAASQREHSVMHSQLTQPREYHTIQEVLARDPGLAKRKPILTKQMATRIAQLLLSLPEIIGTSSSGLGSGGLGSGGLPHSASNDGLLSFVAKESSIPASGGAGLRTPISLRNPLASTRSPRDASPGPSSSSSSGLASVKGFLGLGPDPAQVKAEEKKRKLLAEGEYRCRRVMEVHRDELARLADGQERENKLTDLIVREYFGAQAILDQRAADQEFLNVMRAKGVPSEELKSMMEARGRAREEARHAPKEEEIPSVGPMGLPIIYDCLMAGKKGKSQMIEYLQQEDIQQQLAGEDYRRLQASLEAFLNNTTNLLQVRVELLWRFCVVIGDSYLGDRWTNLTLAKYGYDLILELLETSGYSGAHPAQYAALTNSHSIVASDLGALESIRKLDEANLSYVYVPAIETTWVRKAVTSTKVEPARRGARPATSSGLDSKRSGTPREASPTGGAGTGSAARSSGASPRPGTSAGGAVARPVSRAGGSTRPSSSGAGKKRSTGKSSSRKGSKK